MVTRPSINLEILQQETNSCQGNANVNSSLDLLVISQIAIATCVKIKTYFNDCLRTSWFIINLIFIKILLGTLLRTSKSIIYLIKKCLSKSYY